MIADTLPEALDAQVLDWHRVLRRWRGRGDDRPPHPRRRGAERNGPASCCVPRAGWGRTRSSVGGERFAVGDRIVTRINTPQVSNRERWQVVGIDTAEQRLHLTPPRR